MRYATILFLAALASGCATDARPPLASTIATVTPGHCEPCGPPQDGYQPIRQETASGIRALAIPVEYKQTGECQWTK